MMMGDNEMGSGLNKVNYSNCCLRFLKKKRFVNRMIKLVPSTNVR